HSSVSPVGVELSPDGVKLLQLRRRKGRYEVVSTAKAPLEAASLREALAHDDSAQDANVAAERRLAAAASSADANAEDGQFELPHWAQLVSNAVGVALNAGGFLGSRCTVALSEEFLRVRSVRQPKMAPDEAARAIRLEARDRLGFPEEAEVEVDWIEAGEVRQGEEIRDEVILVGAPTAALAAIAEALESAGLSATSLEPAFLAQARALGRTLRRAQDASTVRLIIDVGRRQTGVVVTKGTNVAFYKALDIGGEQLDEAAAKRLGASVETVADLRRQRMRSRPEERDPRVDRAMYEGIRPVMLQLAQEAALCLRYYSVTFFGQRPVEALLVGDEAREPGLVDAVAETLSVPTAVAKPLDGVALDHMGVDCDRRSELAEWTTATGAALRDLATGSQRGDEGDALSKEAGAPGREAA
ncbi:MAG: hypothetical protein D6824_02050, partial [Planctomycetota bacterium]